MVNFNNWIYPTLQCNNYSVCFYRQLPALCIVYSCTVPLRYALTAQTILYAHTRMIIPTYTVRVWLYFTYAYIYTHIRLDFRRFLESGLRSPREGAFGGERGLISRTAASYRAYTHIRVYLYAYTCVSDVSLLFRTKTFLCVSLL